jgi:NAD(P)H-hydrate repair Nnr-like enzyme with NAD(P)H-hydrate epimerase domain
MEARAADLPTVSVAKTREVDRIRTEDFGIDLIQMMVNARRPLALQVRDSVGGDARHHRVVVLAIWSVSAI